MQTLRLAVVFALVLGTSSLMGYKLKTSNKHDTGGINGFMDEHVEIDRFQKDSGQREKVDDESKVGIQNNDVDNAKKSRKEENENDKTRTSGRKSNFQLLKIKKKSKKVKSQAFKDKMNRSGGRSNVPKNWTTGLKAPNFPFLMIRNKTKKFQSLGLKNKMNRTGGGRLKVKPRFPAASKPGRLKVTQNWTTGLKAPNFPFLMIRNQTKKFQSLGFKNKMNRTGSRFKVKPPQNWTTGWNAKFSYRKNNKENLKVKGLKFKQKINRTGSRFKVKLPQNSTTGRKSKFQFLKINKIKNKGHAFKVKLPQNSTTGRKSKFLFRKNNSKNHKVKGQSFIKDKMNRVGAKIEAKLLQNSNAQRSRSTKPPFQKAKYKKDSQGSSPRVLDKSIQTKKGNNKEKPPKNKLNPAGLQPSANGRQNGQNLNPNSPNSQQIKSGASSIFACSGFILFSFVVRLLF